MDPNAGIYTPAISTSNLNNANALPARFFQIGNEVFVTGRISWQGTPLVGGTATITLSLPVATDFNADNVFGNSFGLASWQNTGVGEIQKDFTFLGNDADVMQLAFAPTKNSHGSLIYYYSYTVTPL